MSIALLDEDRIDQVPLRGKGLASQPDVGEESVVAVIALGVELQPHRPALHQSLVEAGNLLPEALHRLARVDTFRRVDADVADSFLAPVDQGDQDRVPVNDPLDPGSRKRVSPFVLRIRGLAAVQAPLAQWPPLRLQAARPLALKCPIGLDNLKNSVLI